MKLRGPTREYRTWIIDSRRWKDYRPRPGDIVVATYPKCGTTWTQQIVNLLIFQDARPRPLDVVSPWIDRRLAPPVETIWAGIDAQPHRRALKSHLPLDGLPLHDDVRYIHVARDGRDAALSMHNHASGFKDNVLAALDAAGLADETIARAYPRAPADPAEYFHQWLHTGSVAGEADGFQLLSFFAFEKSYWTARHLPNLLLVHYNDLKSDLAGEMRRIASFLDIEINEEMWPSLVEAAGFAFMKREGAALMPGVSGMFHGGKDRFFNKGENHRWSGIFGAEDLALYEQKVAGALPADGMAWLARGRLVAGDPA